MSEKMPLGKYAPMPDCKRCNGAGRYPEGHRNEGYACPCTYFGGDTDLIAPLIADAARKALKDLAELE